MEGDFWTCGRSFGIRQVFKFLEPSAIVESNHFCLMSDDTVAEVRKEITN